MLRINRAKDLVLDHPPLRHIYASALAARARLSRAARDHLRELHYLLRAWRATSPTPPPFLRRRVHQLLQAACHQDERLLPVGQNQFWRSFIHTPEAVATRAEFATYPVAHRVRLRYPRSNDSPERQGDLIILKKWNPCTGEKGVLLITYTEAARRFAAIYDLARIAERYMIVLEPSSWGYQDETFFFYIGSNASVIIQAPWRPDYDFVRELNCNLTPLRLGAGDWVDPSTFRPAPPGPKDFDLAVVSSWSRVKRHADLFRALAHLRRQQYRSVRVALVGYPADWTMADIQRLAHRYGVADLCTFFESIPHKEVADILARSAAYLLLSRREGANRALYEALFCDLPVGVYRGHRGVNTEAITAEVGALFDERNLPETIIRLLDPAAGYRPRDWAMKHTGLTVATEKLNNALRDLALRQGLPWTVNIVPKKNAPNLMYATEGLYRDFESEYATLSEFLLPTP